MNGKCTYRGQFKLGDKNGFGICYHSNGQIKYIGNFKDRLPVDGPAKIFTKDGKIRYEG